MEFANYIVKGLLHPGAVREKAGDKLAKKLAGSSSKQLAKSTARAPGKQAKLVGDTLLLRQGLDRSLLDKQVVQSFHMGNEPPLDFQTITGMVKSLLQDTAPPGGLPHQHFMFQQDGGPLRRVDNDLKFGSEVPNLAPGMRLTIRGVEYHDAAVNGKPALDGIHWTHHRDMPGDGGFIQTPDGKIYQ